MAYLLQEFFDLMIVYYFKILFSLHVPTAQLVLGIGNRTRWQKGWASFLAVSVQQESVVIGQDKKSRSITWFLTFALGCRQNCLLGGDEAESIAVKAAAVSSGSQMCCEGHTEVERLTRELYDLRNKYKNLINENARLCNEIKSLTVPLKIQEVDLKLVSKNFCKESTALHARGWLINSIWRTIVVILMHFYPFFHHAGASAVLAWLWRIASLLASYSSLTLTACGRSYPVEQKMVGASVLFDTAHYIPLWSFCNQLSTQIAADQDRFKMPHQDEMSESEVLR